MAGPGLFSFSTPAGAPNVDAFTEALDMEQQRAAEKTILGCTVQVQGLSDMGADLNVLNGCLGKLTRSRSKLAAGAAVQAHSLVSRPDLNGAEGAIVCWHEDRKRWEVKLTSGTVVALGPANLRIMPPDAIGTWQQIPEPEGAKTLTVWVQREKMDAFASGRHERLGAQSLVGSLTDLALKLIADEVLSGLDVLLDQDGEQFILLKGLSPENVKWVSGQYAPGNPLSVIALRFSPGGSMASLSVHIYIYMYIYIYMLYMYVYLCMCMCTYVCICLRLHMYEHTHVCTYVHAHPHIQCHTYAQNAGDQVFIRYTREGWEKGIVTALLWEQPPGRMCSLT